MISPRLIARSLLILLLLVPLGDLSGQTPPRDPRDKPRSLGGVHGFQRGPSEEEKERIRLRIGITKEQQQQIEALYMETERQKGEVFAKMRELYTQLESLYDVYDFDRNQARSLRREITRQHVQIMMIHVDNEEKLRRILTREQFEKLRAVMREAREKMRRDFEKRFPRPPVPR
jgi:Spy/CpxP family protein refolding chaperone